MLIFKFMESLHSPTTHYHHHIMDDHVNQLLCCSTIVGSIGKWILELQIKNNNIQTSVLNTVLLCPLIKHTSDDVSLMATCILHYSVYLIEVQPFYIKYLPRYCQDSNIQPLGFLSSALAIVKCPTANLNALKWTQHKYALKILSSTGPGRKKSVSVLVEDLDLDLETAWPGLEITFLFWDENLPNVIKSNSACEKGCQDLDQKIFRKDSSFVSRS